jgi:nucleotidyltransferase/DNA polymerase involved in DNA repair
MPIACLLVPSLALACERADRPALRGQPVVIADDGGRHVAEASEEARTRGVAVGQTLREATAFCPAVAVIEPRSARIRRAAEALVAALEAVSPLVEAPLLDGTDGRPASLTRSMTPSMTGSGVVYADLRGLEGLYPDPHDLARAVLEAVPASLEPRLGIASSRFTAFAAAQRAEPRQALHIPQETAGDFLAPLDVAVLEGTGIVEATQIAWMRLLAIDTLGRLAALPRHAVEAQFGLEGSRAWLAARGEDATPLRPREWRERVVETSRADPPLVSRESVERTLEQLLGRALRHQRAHRRFVRVLRLSGATEDDRLWERVQVLKEPSGDRDRLWTIIRSAIEHTEFPGPLAELTLELGGLTEETARQPSLLTDHIRRREQLDEMVRHLKLRFGQSPVARVVAIEPWHRLPERRYALIDYDGN